MNSELELFHEDVFYEYFQPFRHPSAQFNIFGGHGLETFGDDLRLVRQHHEHFVWTVVDSGENSDQWITPGYRYVNRVCYVLTKVPHHWAFIEFRVARNAHSLTHRGLARRISTLKRLLAEARTSIS